MKHLFLSGLAVPAKQWQEAFSDRCVFASQLSDVSWSQVSFVWLMDDFPNIITVVKSLRIKNIPVVVMSLTPSASESVSYFEQGVSGYCHALATPSLMHQIVDSIKAGGIWLGAELMKNMIQSIQDNQAKAKLNKASLALLSKKEKQVAEWVTKGLTNKEVAKELNITDRTVKAHLASIFEKLEVRDRIQLTLQLHS